MIRTASFVAALALTSAVAGVASAQTQTASGAAPPAGSPQLALAPAQSAPPWARSGALSIKPWDPNASHPTYSVGPPPDTPTGIYLPAVVLGYAKSTTGCILVGCEDGPQVSGGPAPSATGSAAPPADAWPSDPGSARDSHGALPAAR